MKNALFILLALPSVVFSMDGKYTIPDDELDGFVRQNGYTDLVSVEIGNQIPNPISKSQFAVNAIDKFIADSIVAKAANKDSETARTAAIATKQQKLDSNKGAILVDVKP